VLPARGNAEPGPLRVRDRTPYMVEILDKLGDDTTEYVVLMKPPQCSGSVTGRSAIGYWADTTTDPILVVYPNEDAAGKQITERVAPMFEASPRLARLLTGRVYDVNNHAIELVHTKIGVGWAGSPQALASDPYRFVVLEETDKYLGKANEAEPDELAEHRTKTYAHRRKIFALSTPTVRSGTIYRLWRQTRDRREYHCPCVHCGALAYWEWSHVRWDGHSDTEDPDALLEIADRLKTGELRAWVECPHCEGQIHEADRMRSVALGEWVSDGYPPGKHPRSKRVAYHLTALVSPWVSFADSVEKFLRCVVKGDMHNHFNGTLGLPAEEATATIPSTALAERSTHPAFIVPEWATTLTAGADTQASGGKPYWVWVIRAWGPNLKSRLIAWGRANTPDELTAQTVDASFPVKGSDERMSPTIVCVDSGGAVETVDGSTTDLVYQMARRDPGRVVAIKGTGRQDKLITARNIDYTPPGMPTTTVLLHSIDSPRLKDIAASLIRKTDPVVWEESAAADQAYLDEMTAEEKTRVRVGRKLVMRWINNTRRRADIWSASIYALAAAKILKVEERAQRRPPKPKQATPRPAQPVAQPSPFQASRRFPGRERSWFTRR